MWANHYVPADAWGEALLVDSAEPGAAASPAIAVDPNGNAVAVWTKAETSIRDVWTARYSVGTATTTTSIFLTTAASMV